MSDYSYRPDPAGGGLPGYWSHWFWNVSIYGRGLRIVAGTLATLLLLAAFAFYIIITEFPTFGYPDCWGWCA